MTTFRNRLLFLGALAAAAACGDAPTGPTESSDGSLPLDHATLVDFAQGDTSTWLTLETQPDSYYVLEVAPKDGAIYVTPFAEGSGTPIGPYVLVSDSTPTILRTTPVAVGPATGSIRYRIDASPLRHSARAVITARQVPAGPELVAAAVTLGDSIAGESLDAPDDVDLFAFTGTSGQVIEPMIHIPGPDGFAQSICASLLAPDGTPLGGVSGFPGDTILTSLQGGRITLPATGTYRLRVNSGRNGCAGWSDFVPYVGPYTFALPVIDPSPETGPQDLGAGDTVTTEGIDRIGDIDRFTIHGAPGSQVELFLQTLGGKLRLDIGGHFDQISVPGDTSWLDRASGRITIPDSGKVTATIAGFTDGPGGDVGPYRFYVDGASPAPESTSPAIAFGDTVSGESIDKLVDVDRFTFTGTTGQLVNVHFSAIGAVPNGSLTLQLYAPDGSTVGPSVSSTVADQDSVDRATGRQTLPAAGTYTVEVRGSDDRDRNDVGAYRVWLRQLDAHPESLADTFNVADPLVGESLDEWGDLDDFYFTLTDSVWIEVGVGFQAPTSTGAVWMTVDDVATGERLANRLLLAGASEGTNPVPAHPGTYRLRIDGVDTALPTSGPYTVWISTSPLSSPAPVGAAARASRRP